MCGLSSLTEEGGRRQARIWLMLTQSSQRKQHIYQADMKDWEGEKSATFLAQTAVCYSFSTTWCSEVSLKDVSAEALAPRASAGTIWLSLDRATAIQVKHFSSSHQNMKKKQNKQKKRFGVFRRCSQAAVWPVSQEEKLHLWPLLQTSLPASSQRPRWQRTLFSTGTWCISIYIIKKKTLLFCYTFHQLDSGESFNLMASAAPCVPRHLLPGESFQTISTACVLNSTRILMQHWSFGWLDRVVKLGLGGDCLSLFWIKWNSHSKSISLFFLHVLLCVSI